MSEPSLNLQLLAGADGLRGRGFDHEAASMERAATRIAELEAIERDHLKALVRDQSKDLAENTAERDRLKAALTIAEQVLDGAQITFRARDMDTREMQIMQACQIARDNARAALSGEGVTS